MDCFVVDDEIKEFFTENRKMAKVNIKYRINS